MPAEVIYADQLPYGEGESARSVVRITWSREASHVQVATLCVHAADHTPFVASHFEEILAKLDEDDAASLRTMMAGLYATLDRHSINKAIRALRRARDQAYGRDE